MLFAILYCRKEGNECTLSVQELVHYLGIELEARQESLQNLEQGGFIKFKEIVISLMPAAFSQARFWEMTSNTKSRMFPVHESEVYF